MQKAYVFRLEGMVLSAFIIADNYEEALGELKKAAAFAGVKVRPIDWFAINFEHHDERPLPWPVLQTKKLGV
jgi:hypothetical protein